MNIKLFLVLLDYKRIPLYLYSVVFALRKNIISYKNNFKGMISLPEGITLFKLANSLKNDSMILEIGCYGGLATAYLLAGARYRDSFMYSIDPFDKELEQQRKIVGQYRNRYYRQVESDSLKNKPSKKSVEKNLRKYGFKQFTLIEGYSQEVLGLWKKPIDLLWIDGNHEFGYVKKDFLGWSRFLKKGGVVVLHDANRIGKSKSWKWGLRGPTEVVKKYIKSPNWLNIGGVDSIVYATKNY